jgi:hypothetical protein
MAHFFSFFQKMAKSIQAIAGSGLKSGYFLAATACLSGMVYANISARVLAKKDDSTG